MSTHLRLKRSLDSGVVPSNGSLELGELAINIADRKVWVGTGGTTAPPVLLSDYFASLTGGVSAGDGITLDSNLSLTLDVEYVIDIIQQQISNAGLGGLKSGYSISLSLNTNGETIISFVEPTWSIAATTTATDIAGVPAGTSLVGLTAFQILEDILYAYQPVVVTAFNTGLGTTNIEIGTEIPSSNPVSTTWTVTNSGNAVAGGVTVLWTSTNLVSGAGYASSSGTVFSGANVGSTPRSTTYDASGNKFRSDTVNGNVVFRINVDQTQGADATTTQTYTWRSKCYYGKSTNNSLTTFTGSSLSGGGNFIVSSTTFPSSDLSLAEVNGYVYVFVHNNFTITKFFIGATDVSSTFTLQSTNTITNSLGASASYKVYRSNEELNGSFTLTIQP